MSLAGRAPSPIFMTADAIGGVWTYALELARALGGFGVDVALATMGRALSAGEKKTAGAIPNLTVFESAYKLEWMDDPWNDVEAAGEWLLGLSDEIEPAVVHLNGYSHGALPWPAPALVVAHSCVYSWFEAVKRSAPPAEWDEYKRRVSAGLAAADLVTAPSGAMLADLNKHYGGFAAAPPVYNGRSAAHFKPAAKEPFVFTAGRLWDEAKNIAVLTEVAKNIAWPIVAAGDSAAPGRKAARLDALKLLGRLDQAALAAQLARASIFALPARYEPFGYGPLEAALAGCALVLGDIPSLREIWGGAALFARPDDADSIAAAIGLLIDDAALRRWFAERARAHALAFTPERMAAAYVGLYERLAYDPSRPAAAKKNLSMRVE